ncbi:MAG: glutathione peroxidase [Alphaproteobacteria bacterium]
MSAHDFEFVSLDGADLPMASLKGRAVLVVNTASECGFTPQYQGLQALWEKYRERGLVVLGVPSNDFGDQEPGTEAEIKRFCEVNYNVTFPMTGKQRVIGGDAHPFYRWVVEAFGEAAAPAWNFHKYLVAPDGSLAGLWPSRVEPLSQEITAAIEEVLPG